MKFTLSWLKTHLETNASLEEISNTLTQIGLEVEEIIDPKAQLKGFLTGHVVEAGKHPDADKLSVCKVDIGQKELIDVVCGAPNVRKDLKIVFATIGSVVPANGMVIKKGKIRGESSHGMICSGAEIGISEESDGIIELPQNTEIGLDVADALALDDPIIEIALTPNRGDCAGVRGIARDLAAAGIGQLKPMDEIKQSSIDTPTTTLDIQDTKGCLAFGLIEISNVQNKPASGNLHRQLTAIGQKTISTLVDITNFFTMDRARPLHVFDADKVQGNLVIRKATSGEKFIALDENEYTLTGIETIIADDSGVISLAGIMGGLSTAVDENTTNIILECALFDPIEIAHAGRAHQIDSDARYRFERQVDPLSLEPGIDAAATMIMELCGGKIQSRTIYGNIPTQEKEIAYSPDAFQKLMGYEVDADTQKNILTKLGFKVSSDFKVSVPSWRPDIENAHCLIEEIARINGYDNIPHHSLRAPLSSEPLLKPRQVQLQNIRRLFASRNYIEAITWSFMSDQTASKFGFSVEDTLFIKNPINSNWNYMRPTILPNLLEAAKNNVARSLTDFNFFEIGPIFESFKPDGQKQMISALRVGNAVPENWASKARTFDAIDIKEDLWHCLSAFGLNGDKMRIDQSDVPSYYHPGRAAKLYLGKMHIANFGEIHPQFISDYALSKSTVGFELMIDHLPPAKVKKTTTKPAVNYSQYQPVFRDFAFILDEKTPAQELINLIESVDKKLVRNISIFDIYQGEHIEAYKKSLAFRVTLQSNTQTLDEEMITSLSDKIITLIETKLNGQLRAA